MSHLFLSLCKAKNAKKIFFSEITLGSRELDLRTPYIRNHSHRGIVLSTSTLLSIFMSG